jgi:hypothetical protein
MRIFQEKFKDEVWNHLVHNQAKIKEQLETHLGHKFQGLLQEAYQNLSLKKF